MSENEYPRSIARHLNASLAEIKWEHRERLRLARSVALELHAQRSAVRFAGFAGAFHVDYFARRALLWFAALLLVAFGIAYWHAQSYIVDLTEVDSAILIDEMPMDVITDKGFDAWLRSPALR
jgi:Protein of unknown function (DUF3619)